MSRTLLREDQWERIKGLLPGKATDCGVTAMDNRLFIEAVLWIARTGSPWRDLDPALGNWHATYTRFSRWGKKGVWQRIIAAIRTDADLEALLIDSTVVRAHQHAAGAQKKDGPQARGHSRGGLSTTIHSTVDALGNPLRWILTGGEVADITQARTLIEGLSPEAVIGDKGYDADALVAYIHAMGAEAVIPLRSNRTEHSAYDRHVYKDRIWWSVSLIGSSSFAAWPHAMKNWHATSCPCSTS